MNLEQINARLAEIRSLLDNPNEEIDIDALSTEAQGLIAQRNQLQNAETRRQQLRLMIAGGSGTQLPGPNSAGGQSAENRGADSIEYRNAWLKNLARDNEGRMLLGDMTVEERAAFTFTTENTGSVVPTMVANRIAELVRSTAPLLADSTSSNFARGFGVPRHKSIEAGDAKAVSEGAANDDEQDGFDLLALDGEEIKKHIEMSRKMQIQSIDAFYTWVTTHLADRIRAAKERMNIQRLNDAEVGMAPGNKLTGDKLTDDLVLQAMGLLDAAGRRSVYANSATIWNHIAKLKDEKGDKLFIPNSMSDPVVQGRLYGAEVKEDTELSDGVILFGVGRHLLTNDFEALAILASVDPKTLKRIITGYSLYDAGLENPKAFSQITLTAAAQADAGGA